MSDADLIKEAREMVSRDRPPAPVALLITRLVLALERTTADPGYVLPPPVDLDEATLQRIWEYIQRKIVSEQRRQQFPGLRDRLHDG